MVVCLFSLTLQWVWPDVGLRLTIQLCTTLQGGLLGKAMNASGALRNRMLADPTFIFKVFTEVSILLYHFGFLRRSEFKRPTWSRWLLAAGWFCLCLQIAIDSACATVAEVQKRGKDFWNEFDFYLADLLVGIALDVLLVGLLAPFVRFGAAPAGSGASAKLSRSIMALPSRYRWIGNSVAWSVISCGGSVGWMEGMHDGLADVCWLVFKRLIMWHGHEHWVLNFLFRISDFSYKL